MHRSRVGADTSALGGQCRNFTLGFSPIREFKGGEDGLEDFFLGEEEGDGIEALASSTPTPGVNPRPRLRLQDVTNHQHGPSSRKASLHGKAGESVASVTADSGLGSTVSSCSITSVGGASVADLVGTSTSTSTTATSRQAGDARPSTSPVALAAHPFESGAASRLNFPGIDEFLATKAPRSGQDGGCSTCSSEPEPASPEPAEQGDGGNFRWSIDQLANLLPVEIEPTADKVEGYPDLDRLTPRRKKKLASEDRRRQQEIDRFFHPTNRIVPSPWIEARGPAPSGKLHVEAHNDSHAASPVATKKVTRPTARTVSCQTEWSFPAEVDLNALYELFLHQHLGHGPTEASSFHSGGTATQNSAPVASVVVSVSDAFPPVDEGEGDEDDATVEDSTVCLRRRLFVHPEQGEQAPTAAEAANPTAVPAIVVNELDSKPSRSVAEADAFGGVGMSTPVRSRGGRVQTPELLLSPVFASRGAAPSAGHATTGGPTTEDTKLGEFAGGFPAFGSPIRSAGEDTVLNAALEDLQLDEAGLSSISLGPLPRGIQFRNTAQDGNGNGNGRAGHRQQHAKPGSPRTRRSPYKVAGLAEVRRHRSKSGHGLPPPHPPHQPRPSHHTRTHAHAHTGTTSAASTGPSEEGRPSTPEVSILKAPSAYVDLALQKADAETARNEQLDKLENGHYYRQARHRICDIRDELTKARADSPIKRAASPPAAGSAAGSSKGKGTIKLPSLTGSTDNQAAAPPKAPQWRFLGDEEFV